MAARIARGDVRLYNFAPPATAPSRIVGHPAGRSYLPKCRLRQIPGATTTGTGSCSIEHHGVSPLLRAGGDAIFPGRRFWSDVSVASMNLKARLINLHLQSMKCASGLLVF
jgi:hypothetical protein